MSQFFKHTAVVFSLTFAPVAAAAQDVDVDALLKQLADPETQNWQQIERQLRTEWSRSGSASMDLLLQRGEKALEAEDYDAAIEHLTALTDHAPGFAEGWNARATAFFYKKLYGPAIEDLSRALSLNPNHFAALTGLAVILQDIGMSEQSREVWEMLRVVHPHREEIDKALQTFDRLNGARDL